MVGWLWKGGAGRNGGDLLSLALLLLCYVKQWLQAELSLADSIFPGQHWLLLHANVQEDDPAPCCACKHHKSSTTHEAQAKLTKAHCKHMNARAQA